MDTVIVVIYILYHCSFDILYCNLIKSVREHYKEKGKGGKTYEEGFNNGWAAAIDKLKELA